MVSSFPAGRLAAGRLLPGQGQRRLLARQVLVWSGAHLGELRLGGLERAVCQELAPLLRDQRGPRSTQVHADIWDAPPSRSPAAWVPA